MQYSQEVIRESLKLRDEGISSTEVCNKFHISISTLRKWEVEDKVVVPSNMTDSQLIWNLKCRLYETLRELEIWNQCTSSRKSKLSEKYEDLERLSPKYGVHAVCKVLDVPRGTYYNHLLRSPDKPQWKVEDEKFKPLIEKVFDETKGMIGAEKIRTIMMKRGYLIGTKHIRRLMSEMNLFCTTRQKAAHNTEPPRQIYYVNRLKQAFDVDKPNTVWASDTTYLYLNYEPYFLTVIMDLFSRKIIGYGVVDSISAFPLIQIFKKTFTERGNPEGLMFHSDQGSQFTAYRFKQLLRGYKVVQSFSAPANPHDNAVVESFFRNIKAELIKKTFFKNLRDMRSQIDDYIVFYNTVRPHSKLKNKTPEEFENDYCKMIF